MEGRGERYMEKVKKVLDRIFIEGLSAMAHGLFATVSEKTQREFRII